MSKKPTSSRFEEWVRDHHAAVYRSAYRLVQNAEDAQDVTQEVFVQALEQRGRLADAEDARRVLCWMASKNALMHLRGDRRRKHREEAVAAMREREYEQPDRDDRIATLLAKLPDELRIALTLRFQEELTFAQISEAMAVSEPSAHDRVQRGLAKLREWLKRGSPAVLAIDLEQGLRELPAARVPSGLDERLLRLESMAAPATTLATKLVLSCCALLIVATGIGAYTLSKTRHAESTSESATLSAVEEGRVFEALTAAAESSEARVAVETHDAQPRSASQPAKATATIAGRVLQPDATPAVGVDVIANSYIGSGMKFASYSGSSTTNENGEYSLQVGVRHDDGEDYKLHVRYEKAILTREQSLRVQSGEKRTGFDLQLPSALEETDGEYELSLAVVDEAGDLLPAGSIVTLERNLHTVGNGTYPHWESGGRIDIAGRVQLAGAKLGPKRVRASARVGDEWNDYEAFFEIDRAGSHVMQVTAKLLIRKPLGEFSYTYQTSKFGLSGTARELRTGDPVKAVYPDVWYYQVPDISARDYLHDFLPNKIFRGSFQSAALSEAPPETDRFESYNLQAGRYVAAGYESPYAPTFSAVVELSEEFPHADGLELLYDVPGSVEGVVRDVDGSPLEGVVVFVTGTGPISGETVAGFDEVVRKSNGEGRYHSASWRSDENGRFYIQGLSPEVPVRVVALHPTREPAGSRTIYATAGVSLADIDVQFSRKRTR